MLLFRASAPINVSALHLCRTVFTPALLDSDFHIVIWCPSPPDAPGNDSGYPRGRCLLLTEITECHRVGRKPITVWPHRVTKRVQSISRWLHLPASQSYVVQCNMNGVMYAFVQNHQMSETCLSWDELPRSLLLSCVERKNTLGPQISLWGSERHFPALRLVTNETYSCMIHKLSASHPHPHPSNAHLRPRCSDHPVQWSVTSTRQSSSHQPKRVTIGEGWDINCLEH